MIPHSLFYLDRIISHRLRHSIMLLLDFLILLMLLVAGFGYWYEVNILFNKPLGIIAMALSFRLLFLAYEAYFRSYYFATPTSFLESERLEDSVDRNEYHPIKAFFTSIIGSSILDRGGIREEDREKFLIENNLYQVPFNDNVVASSANLRSWVISLIDENKEFENLLFEKGLRKEDLLYIVDWMTRREDARKEYEWWWNKSRLARTFRIGIEWAYPETWTLDKYGYDLADTGRNWKPKTYTGRKDVMNEIISILSRAREANVMLVGAPGVGKKEVVKDFIHKLILCESPSHLCNKRVFMLNPLLLISASKEKGIFEETFINLLREASNAGNIILVIDNFPEFITSAENLGSSVSALLDDYLNTDMPIIALANEYQYHQLVEGEQEMMNAFEVVKVEEPEGDFLMQILEETAEFFERRNGIYFTFQGLKEIRESGERYFMDGVMPEKAIDLMSEIVSYAIREHVKIITENEVESFVREKTQIPVGEISEDEKRKLLHLEDVLHRRVVGQDEAINAVSNSLRRTRADIGNTKRPMGAFLFLGPTGVGKTETAKSLADAFFGGEEHILRLDMSEFHSIDSLERLIGSFDAGKPGVLSSMLRSHPYGVLLLDEFEKASREVHNLFLQILDEGFYSDMNGRRVNARNIIFIATSNAGSNMIYEAVENGVNLNDKKDQIIDSLIKDNLFRPELINRFDAAVLFHPLGRDHIEKVAILQLGELAERLRDRNIHLVINRDLIDAAVKYGYDPKFGAREMRRAIQDKIEKVIAEKIIMGEAKEGSELTLNKSDLE